MTFHRFLKQNARWLIAGSLLTFMSSFGQTFFISVFSGVIRNEFSLTHGAWGGIYSLGTVAAAIVMVWAGGLTDRFRVRALGIVFLTLLAAACLAMAAIPSVWALPFIIFALRLSGQGMVSHIAMVAMARWFVAMRGRALAMASLGFAVGEALLPLTFVALLTTLPWRNLWVIAAMLVMLSIPLLLRLLKTERTPKSVSEESHAHGMSDRHWLRREVLGHRLFWLMVPALLGPSAFITAFFFQQVHLAEIKGWSHAGLVALFPLLTIVGVVATLVSGWAVDRFGTARLTPIYQLPLVAAFLVLSFAQTLIGAAVAMVIMSLTIGANSTVPSAFWAEFYGTRHLGSIKAMTTAVMVLGSAIGPGLTGVLIDYGIGFDDQMIGIAVYFIFASGMAWMGIRQAKHLLPAPS